MGSVGAPRSRTATDHTYGEIPSVLIACVSSNHLSIQRLRETFSRRTLASTDRWGSRLAFRSQHPKGIPGSEPTKIIVDIRYSSWPSPRTLWWHSFDLAIPTLLKPVGCVGKTRVNDDPESLHSSDQLPGGWLCDRCAPRNDERRTHGELLSDTESQGRNLLVRTRSYTCSSRTSCVEGWPRCTTGSQRASGCSLPFASLGHAGRHGGHHWQSRRTVGSE
jgi:hypothetical protein